jgi:hypothetical protein
MVDWIYNQINSGLIILILKYLILINIEIL